MQITCLDCYRKHIATAMSFEDEAAIGDDYLEHKWLAIGELNAAAKECAKKYPILANMTRDYYKAYILNNTPIPTIELIRLATELSEKENLIDIEEGASLNNVEE